MRELVLLRHAHAESAAPGQDDHERALSARGRAEAAAAGAWLKEIGFQPDRVLCSSAKRARETLDVVQQSFGPAQTESVDAIYEATPGELIAIADGHRDVPRLLMVGHNPGFEHLAALMSTGQSGDFRGMPAAGIAVLRMPADAALEPGVAKLSAFWMP